VDGIPVPFPAGEAGIEAVLERLGEDGVAAVGAALLGPPAEMVIAQAGN